MSENNTEQKPKEYIVFACDFCGKQKGEKLVFACKDCYDKEIRGRKQERGD